MVGLVVFKSGIQYLSSESYLIENVIILLRSSRIQGHSHSLERTSYWSCFPGLGDVSNEGHYPLHSTDGVGKILEKRLQRGAVSTT